MGKSITLAAALFAASAVAQGNSQNSPSDGHDMQVLTAKVVRYNRAVMTATYEGDLIVRIDGSGQFAHLVYSPYDFGFEDPPADVLQLLPRSMTSDGSRLWTFTVHPPRGFREQGPCNAARAETNDGNEKPVPLDMNGFVPVPGTDGVKLPPIASLPCFVIQSWSGGERPGSTSTRPERAAR
jgi:hypothetical protein